MKVSFPNLTPSFQTYHYDLILGLCALFLAYVIATRMRKPRNNFPPGPTGLPLVGYLPFLTRDIHLDLTQLGKKYGDVFSIKLGSQDILVLNGADAILEALNKPEFLGRPPDSALQRAFSSSAFFGCNFVLWKEQRRSVVQFMKELGLGQSKIEENVMEEISCFMDVLRKSDALPVDIRKPVCCSLSNNLTSLIFGKRFDYDDPKRQFLDENLKEFFNNFSQINLGLLFPWINYIPFASKFGKSLTALKKYEIFCMREINEHLKTFNPAQPRDFIDRYLLEIDKQRMKHPDTSFNQNMLITNLIDLIIAGTENVEAALLWILYILAAFPDVQRRVQREMEEVIGPDKTPEYMDMKNLPYTRAVFMEALRWKVPLPLTGVHAPLVDATVGGYRVPKDRTVLYNLWAIHHDPRIWEDPERFDPGRFLSEDGESVIRPKFFVPFLAGGRACPGESMTHLQLFLYITSILREFDVSFPDGTEPTFKGIFWLIYRPEPYLVRFIPRN